ncbi:type II toxin-antitoxin system PemK/MazF family toxin [Natrialbaceae archaeon GCM10025810]|uniref:type II toxin-antitoxin system PemK/MazF family toxin n=1 Tax=Halovalidus salilacus TaxID=3075124 RepID=UPI003615AD4D
MTQGLGEVWWGPAPHKDGPSYRPWVVVSDDSHAFSHVECISLAMTTQRHSGGVTVPDDAWVRGGSRKQSYISPWYVATIKRRDFDRCQGELERRVVAEAIDWSHEYTFLDE